MVDWLTIGLGIYGGLITTIDIIYIFYQNLRKIKVSVNASIIGSPGYFHDALSISFSNKGKRQVQIDGFGFILPNKRILSILRPLIPFSFPVILPEGRGYSVYGDIRGMASAMRDEGFSDIIKIRGFVRDATSKKYISKKIKFNINQWIEH